MNARKITLGQMRSSGVRGLLVYCSDHKCSHKQVLEPAMVDQWSDDMSLSEIEARFRCQACGIKGADIRPDFLPAKMGTPHG